ncbi:hypothetical protein B0I18_1192 [Taibaiella chishuiensis]|uniref:Uncharacterized protein n=2 Tax=Taibaiella chishuiensis TaxID=1434707 RepID=A0A2P8CPH7_9BACT|nr:hypothetical protein B0I18_1192 [Taibaiella chishuiensis]
MGNNPVSNVDYLGDIFTFANAGLQNSYNNLRSDNNSRMAGYTKELGGLDLKTESGAKRGEELTKLINAHAEFNTQLDAMEQSSAEFHISNEAAPRGFQGGADYNWSEGRVKFSMGSNSVGSGILAHELRHGYGYLIGELSGSRYDDPLYDMTDEVVAYKTASLFGTESDAIKFGVGSWGIKEFAGSIETNGYRNLKGREVSLTINTPASILINYSKDGSLNNFIKSSNNANLTVGEAISSFNQITKSTQGSERYLWGNQLKRK